MNLNLSSLTKWLADIAAPLHKYAALTVAILAGLGVTPGTAADQHVTTIVGAAYAAVVHAFDSLAGKSTAP